MEDLERSEIGVRRDIEIKGQRGVLVFGKPVYRENGNPAGYYLVYGDGFTNKSHGPLKPDDTVEYVDGRPC